MPVLWDVVDHEVETSDGETFLRFLSTYAPHLPPGSTLVMVRATRVMRRSAARAAV